MSKDTQLASTNQTDIINSNDWTDSQWKDFFKSRLKDMQSVRPDESFNKYENQTTAISYYDNDGMLQINVPLEKTLGEIYMGKTKGKVRFDILPDGQTDVEELQPAKYSMMFYMDGNHKDNFWKENKTMREQKKTYGSGIFFTGIRNYIEEIPVPKEGANIQNGTDILNEDNFDMAEKETWFFFPKAIHPKDFWIDDKANNQPDVQYADDCIMKERITALELEIRYKNNKAIKNLDQVSYWSDPNPKNRKSGTVQQREIILYHYFHRIKKTYMIVANQDIVLYQGKYLYDDGKLPFENIQHYSAIDRFWGEGIPERIAYLKAYKSEVFQDILSGSAMSNSVNLLTWNDDQVWQDWNVWGRNLNIWRSTWDVWQVQPINTSPNLGYMTTVIELIDKEITINSGINPAEQFEQTSDKLGIVEIQEANKAVRNASVDENYEIWLDGALTMMFARIKQFAPALEKEEILDSKWEVIKVIFPKIKIDWFTVEKVKWQQVFTENLWKFWYFELKPDIVQWIWVKIVTASTNSTMPILERQKITDYINNLFRLAEVASLDQSGESIAKLNKFMRFDELLGWISDAYDYDINWLKADTEKDEIAKENIEKIEQIQKLLTINPLENDWQNTELPPSWQAPIPWVQQQGLAQPSGEVTQPNTEAWII